MSRVFCYSVIHGLRSSFALSDVVAKTIKHAFSVLYFDKSWLFDQSECAQGPIYIVILIITRKKSLLFCLPIVCQLCTIQWNGQIFPAAQELASQNISGDKAGVKDFRRNPAISVSSKILFARSLSETSTFRICSL